MTIVLLSQKLDLVKKAFQAGHKCVAVDLELRIVNRVQCDGVHNLARSGAKDDANPSLKAEVGEESNVLGSLLTFGQFRENQKAPPPFAASAYPDTLQANRQVVEKRFRHTSSPNDHVCSKVFVCQVDEGEDDTDREDPFGDIERNRRLDFRGPCVEGEQLDGSEGIDSVDSNRDSE